MSVVLERSFEQRMEALRRANAVRTAGKDLKRELKAGRRRIADVLLDPPAVVCGMKAIDFVLAAPKLGRVKVNRVFQRCAVSPSKTLGGLTDRQRAALAEALS